MLLKEEGVYRMSMGRSSVRTRMRGEEGSSCALYKAMAGSAFGAVFIARVIWQQY